MTTPPRPLVRRPISIGVLSVVSIASITLSPVVVPVLAGVDLVTGSPMRRSRIWALYVGALFNEALGTWSAVGLTLWHLGRLDSPASHDRFHRLEWWWATRHLRNLRRFAGLRWVVDNPELLDRGDAVVLARHASHADAVLPVLLYGIHGRRRCRYTLKDDLQWSPAMDLVGNRLPNVFIDRHPDPDSRVWDELRRLGEGLEPGAVAVIFPEGTFHNPERLDRAARRIGRTRPDLEAKARRLRHLLPPRPAGARALLTGASHADIVLVAHVGMEAFGELAAIRRALPLREPVHVRLWRIPRDEIPGDDRFDEWLLDRWLELDGWIQHRLDERDDNGGGPMAPPGAVALDP